MTRGENILLKKWVQSDLHTLTDSFYFSGTETSPAGPGATSITSVPTPNTNSDPYMSWTNTKVASISTVISIQTTLNSTLIWHSTLIHPLREYVNTCG
jgi:hypothetical protein